MVRSHPEQRVLVEVDARGRCSLGRLGVKPGALFLGNMQEDGTILLTPAELRPINQELEKNRDAK